jgi:hypothetical protein
MPRREGAGHGGGNQGPDRAVSDLRHGYNRLEKCVAEAMQQIINFRR